MECLDDDEETSQICGLCGVIPEAVLGENNNVMFVYSLNIILLISCH